MTICWPRLDHPHLQGRLMISGRRSINIDKRLAAKFWLSFADFHYTLYMRFTLRCQNTSPLKRYSMSDVGYVSGR